MLWESEKALYLEKELQEEVGPGGQFRKLCIIQITASAAWVGSGGGDRGVCRFKIHFGWRYY